MSTLVSGRNLFLIIIFFLGFFLRFYLLSEFPIHLNLDEISQLYEAISIAQTGKDIYGNFLPTVFPLFGVYAPGHYIYITSLVYKIFGEWEIIIRIPAALMGALTILSVAVFVNKLFNNFKITILSAFLVAIAPSEIFYSRKSFEYMDGHFFVFLGLSFLLTSLEKSRSYFWGIIGGVFLALAMYTYTAHTFSIPLIIISFGLIFIKKIVSQKRSLWFFLSWFICILPLIYMIFTNPDMRYRASTIFITKDPFFGGLINISKSDNPFLSYFYQTKTLVDYSFNRYLSQFDPAYLFANGLDLTNQGFLDMGPLYFWQLPFLIMGIVFVIRSSLPKQNKRFLVSLMLLSIVAGSLTFESHSPHRSVMAFTLISIFSATGLYWFLGLLNNFKQIQRTGRFYIFMTLLWVPVLNFVYFVHIYTVNYPNEKSQNIYYPFKLVAQFLWSQYDNFPQIIFDPQFGEIVPEAGAGAHYYLAYYGHYPPAKFQKEYRIGDKPREIIFDKFSIRQVYWPEDKDLRNILMVASIWSVPIDKVDKSKIIKRFDFYNGSPAFYAIKL